MDILLYSTILKQEDFLTPLVWLLSFIIIFSFDAYFFKQKIIYLLSIIFTFILIIKSINYLIDINRKSTLNIYSNDTELIFITKRDDEIIKKQIFNYKDIHNLQLKNIIEKDRGSTSTFHYKAIIYTNDKSEERELISTRNMFDGKFISVYDLNNIFDKIKLNDKIQK